MPQAVKTVEREQHRRAFSITLRALRTEAQIAQEALALRAGIDRGYMSGLERGKHSPTLDTIYKLLGPLGVSFEQFAASYDGSVRRVVRVGKSASTD